jgi:hypothetical protein
MKNQSIVTRNEEHVIGVLSGWDRLALRGCFRLLEYVDGMMIFLYRLGVLLKNYSEWALTLSNALKEACLAEAEQQGRPVIYVRSPEVRKDDLAREVLRDQPVSRGLICVITSLDPCDTYRVHGNRATQRLELRRERTKCLHVYKYWLDHQFGFLGARLQTWLPCRVEVWINGREWLAHRLDRRGIAYRRDDNCFPWIADFAAAQKVMNQVHRTRWIESLNRIWSWLCPEYLERFGGLEGYWTAYQSEWATDICFDSVESLRAIYRPLVRGAMTVLGCEDILRFMNKRRHVRGEVQSDYRLNPEGVRVKHKLHTNSVKAYDKAGSVLRIETTINRPSDFRVFRTKQGDPEGPKAWRSIRKSVVDLKRRAEVSEQVNRRYSEALGSLDTTTEVGQLAAPICRPVRRKGVRYRGLRPWSKEDRPLLEAVCRGEYVTAGFTNRDIAGHLYGSPSDDPAQRARIASRVCYRLRLLRQHGLIRKVKDQRRYHLTPKGRQILSAVLAAQHATLQQLNALAA